MDSKNDDSAGSDSLDKSLQKKCNVMDDLSDGGGGGGGTNLPATTTTAAIGCNSINTTTKDKTEIHSVCEDGRTKSVLTTTVGDKATTSTAQGSLPGKGPKHPCPPLTSTSPPTTCNNSTSCKLNSSSNNNNAFESTVKQISQNLRETTLAETQSTSITGTCVAPEEGAATTQPPCGSSAGACTEETLESDQSSKKVQFHPEAKANEGVNLKDSTLGEAQASESGTSSEDPAEQDQRSKKVRFHPDVKENDGGNRIIPKKRKKIRNAGGGDEAGVVSNRGDEEMEFEEEGEDGEDEEEEDEFDLAKTLAEAQDYLKAHPLTFVRPSDKSSEKLQNGLLDEEDLSQMDESSEEEEDLYKSVAPEWGVERILGKQTCGGKVEYLIRYTDRPGIHWETEEFISRNCPNLLAKYEENRELRQERLMRHVAKRQNARQRYTDF